jgi:CRP-like cAMP-binding protein
MPNGEKYMADFLDEKRSEIGARLKELKPLVDEYQRLEAAAAALDGMPSGAPAASRAAGTRAARAPAKRRSSGGGGRRGRPKGSGTRGAEALALVKESPGITIPELAAKMGIKQNYLYRVLPGLAEDGLVSKDGRGWHPKDAA